MAFQLTRNTVLHLKILIPSLCSICLSLRWMLKISPPSPPPLVEEIRLPIYLVYLRTINLEAAFRTDPQKFSKTFFFFCLTCWPYFSSRCGLTFKIEGSSRNYFGPIITQSRKPKTTLIKEYIPYTRFNCKKRALFSLCIGKIIFIDIWIQDLCIHNIF